MRFISVLFFIAVFLMSGKMTSNDVLSSSLNNKFVDNAVVWIAQNTPYKDAVNQKVPSVKIVTPTILSDLIKNASGIASIGLRDVAAAYLPAQNLIAIDVSIDNDIEFMGHLIHELIHHYQILNKKNERVDCVASLEEEAYRYQIKYLEAMNAPEDYILKIRFSSLIYGRCRPRF